MSWFGDFLDGISGTKGDRAALNASQQQTDAATLLALSAQKDAQQRALDAATPAIDTESGHLAGEAQVRKMLAAAGFRFQGQPTGNAPLGFTTTYGE